MPMVRVGYFLSQVQLDKLKRLMDTTGISVSEHIRRAVDEYLDKHQPPDQPDGKTKPPKK